MEPIMNSAPRMPISDLITEFNLHDDRKHFYVEGKEDRAVLEWFLEQLPANRFAVFEIDSIEIAFQQLNDHGFTEGQRNRVIVLAREFDSNLSEDSRQALCIIDADYDYILDNLEQNRFLAYTDGTSLNMYAISEQTVERVVRLGFRDYQVNPKGLFANLFHVLKEVFLIRAANESLQWGMKWLPFEKRCKFQRDGSINFDYEKFICDYVKKNGVFGKLEEFLHCRDRLAMQNLGARERWIRAHDFGTLLNKFIRSVIGSKFAHKMTTSDIVVRMLFVGLDRREIESAPLFQRILDFLRH